jgi:hypothetical protein
MKRIETEAAPLHPIPSPSPVKPEAQQAAIAREEASNETKIGAFSVLINGGKS